MCALLGSPHVRIVDLCVRAFFLPSVLLFSSFDTISYCKGCVVIRQLEAFLGADVFRAGLIRYIKQYRLSNAVTADLWRVLSEASGKDVQSMMQAWTKETGFPLLTIEEDPSAPAGTLQFKATQRRFLQTGPDASSEVTWPVPITFLVAGQQGTEPVGKQVFAAREGVLRVEAKEAGLASSGAAPKWIKLNGHQANMYRVHYSPKLFAALVAAVDARDPLLSASDRLGVQSDAFALARCGLLSTVQLLELVQSYAKETDPAVWSDLLSNLADIALLVQDDAETYDQFARYVHRLLAQILAQVGWTKAKDEAHVTSLLRAKVIGASGRYGQPDTVQKGLERFAAFFGSGQAVAAGSSSAAKEGGEVADVAAVDEESQLSPDLRGAVYGMVVAHGGLAGYESLLYLRSKVSLSEEQVRCLQSLAASRDPALLRRTLDLALSPAVRTQDGPSLIAAVASNRFGTALCWEWTKQRWSDICKKFGQSSSLSRIVGQCGNFASAELGAEVRSFFASHAHPGAERAVKQAVERIDSNSKWRQRDLQAAKEWLKKHDEQQQQQQQVAAASVAEQKA
jgi:puromycin-sensitive aminopeptidase